MLLPFVLANLLALIVPNEVFKIQIDLLFAFFSLKRLDLLQYKRLKIRFLHTVRLVIHRHLTFLNRALLLLFHLLLTIFCL